jgi:hypothetical protein
LAAGEKKFITSFVIFFPPFPLPLAGRAGGGQSVGWGITGGEAG